MDLSNLTAAELRELQQQIPFELKRRESQEKNEALIQVRAVAKSLGYALEELVDKEGRTRSGTGVKVMPKYRHPENAALEWTGRGRQPMWVKAWVEAGGSLDSLRI